MTIHAIADKQTEARPTFDLTEVSGRKVEFDYLRVFVITLVLFHHAISAYTMSAAINFTDPIVNSSPVVNELRWIGFDLIMAFNETYFMPLLFFLSGLFVWPSLVKKGAFEYLKGRLRRLGIPFVIGVFFLIPLAYYPAQLQIGQITGVESRYGTFWFEMIRSGFRTAGPLWFLWLLLAFDCMPALLYRVVPLREGFIRERSTNIFGRSITFFGVLLGISIAVYLPVALFFGPLKWIGIGPIHAQAGRILLYLTYFLAGTAVRSCRFDRTAFRSDGALAKHWWGWSVVGLMSFIVFIIIILLVKDRTIFSELAFASCCWGFVFGMTGFFLRFAKKRISIIDNLSENSYGIYIVHYVFITWLQYLLLGSSLVPIVKGIIVFVGTLILSWLIVAAVRRLPMTLMHWLRRRGLWKV